MHKEIHENTRTVIYKCYAIDIIFAIDGMRHCDNQHTVSTFCSSHTYNHYHNAG